MAENEYGNRENIFNMMQAFSVDGQYLEMAQNLVQVNDLLRYTPTFPANENLSHRGARYDSLPEAVYSALGDAVTSSFARISSYREVLGILRSRWQCPEDILKAQGEPSQMDRFRTGQERANIEGMTQGQAQALLRGASAANHERLDGIFQRAPWNSITNTTYVFDAGGTGSTLRSALLIKPGQDTFHLLHPKYHATKGIERIDRGSVPVLVTTTDANGTSNATRFDVMTDFEYWGGWNIVNQKAIKRIVNIPVDYASLSALIVRKIIEARHRHSVISSMPGAVNPQMMVEAPWHLYCDPLVYTQLVDYTLGKLNVNYTANNPYKIELPMIGDIIILRMDALDEDESQLTT